MPRIKWTPQVIATAKAIFGKHERTPDALRELSRKLGQPVSEDSVRCAFHANGIPSLHSFLKKPTYKEKEIPPQDRFRKLIDCARKQMSFSAICDVLDVSPSKAREIINAARRDGIKIHVENDHVGLKIAEPLERVQNMKIAPTAGKRQKIAVISDTHLGSKYCLREQLCDFINYAYDQGVREILHPGDVLDGDYRHGKFEMSHMGIDEQTRDLFETLPRLGGLTYHGITGNHDHTFSASAGVDAGEFIEQYFAARGRTDFKFYGNRGAYLKLRGALIYLWHPRSAGAYAVSYPIQKKIEGFASLKPQILLVGHFHKFVYVYERGVHGIGCPTFQVGRSEFSKSLVGSPALGGLILSWDITREGTIRSFVVEKRSYFDREQPFDANNPLDAFEVEQCQRDRSRVGSR